MLPGISTEQLRSRLNRMVADGMLTRKRYREVPPRVDYELTERAHALMPVLGALARWGYDWTWSDPRPSESVDVAAIFRLAPGLLSPAEPARCVTLMVTDRECTYTVEVGAGEVRVHERETERADAHVSGSESAWIAALSPSHDRSGLTITGSESVAAGILDGLADNAFGQAGASRRAAAA